MNYRRSARFKKALEELPKPIKEKVPKVFLLFKQNPQHPSLGVKKLKRRKDIWEGRIDDFYRFTFEYQTDPKTGETVCYFRNVGRHEIIDDAP